MARGAARRVAGRMLHLTEAAELIAAEVLSAVPIDEQADEGSCEEAGVSWSQEKEPEGETAETAVRPPWRGKGGRAWASDSLAPAPDPSPRVAAPPREARRRRMERDEGRLPTAGEALGAMLDHVLSSWDALDGDGKVIRPGVTPLLSYRSGDLRV